MWAQSGPVTLTFNRPNSTTTVSEVAVTVTGAGANATASVSATGVPGTAPSNSQKTGELLSLGNITDAIVCFNANANGNPTIKLTLEIDGLPENFTFNTVGLYTHAVDLNGGYQTNSREWNISIDANDDNFASVTNLDIVKPSAHMNRDIKAEQSKTITGNSLTLTLTITKGANNTGCFFGLESITLSNVQTTEVTYHLMYNETDKATEAVEEQLGAEPALPSSFQRDYCSFTYYSDQACTQPIETITDETNDIYVKAKVNTEELPFTLSTDYNSATWYYLHGHSTYADRYISTNEDATVYAVGNSMTAAYLWAFLGNPIDGIKLINKASGEEKALQGTNPATMGTDGKAWILKKQTATGHNYGVGKSFGLYDTQLTYLNTQDGTLKYWTNFDQGSTFWVEEPAEVYQALIASLKAVANNVGEGLGKYHLTGTTTVEEMNKQISELEGNFTYENVLKAKNLLAELPVALNMPTEGMFLRFKGSFDKYLADGNSSTGPYNYTTNEDATTIFYFDDSHLVNLSSGKSVGMTNGNSATEGWPWYYGTEQASTVTFSEGGTKGSYHVHIGHDNSFAYLRVNSDENCVRRGESGTDWSLEEIKTLPISIAEVGYATLWSPVALSIPENVTAYTGTISEDEETLNLTELQGVIPAETAVILKGEESTYNFPLATGSTSDTSNDLQGGLGSTTTTLGHILTLQPHPDTSVFGFYTYNNAEGLPAFKAYLDWNGKGEAQSIKGIAFGTDTTDGIATVEGTVAESSAIYNLAGQRVEKAVKGVYIVNGKKVLVK